MKSVIKLILFFIMISQGVLAQVSNELRASFVMDSITGESIQNAHILNTNSNKGTITNKVGYFEIECSDTDSLRFSYVSYTSITLCCKSLTMYTMLTQSSSTLDEVILKPLTWQQFKLEFVQTKWSAEQSSEIKIHGVKQYKGPLLKPTPTLATAIKSPISFTHYLLNKKSRQRRKTKRYKRIIQNSYYN